MAAVPEAVERSSVRPAPASPPPGLIEDTDLRDIIRQRRDIPAEVADAVFSHVVRRELDYTLFTTITTQSITSGAEEEWEARLEKRRTALREHVGDELICVFVCLPRIHYTMEIDPLHRRLVYWEWQAY